MPVRRTSRTTTRREVLQSTCGLAAGLWIGGGSASRAQVQPRSTKGGLTVTGIDRVTVKVPFREVPARNMDREIPHWRYSEIVSVTLAGGVVGHGETLLYYTWGATSDDDVNRARGENAVELMWDDTLGAGLQMALFDAVAKASDVPIHRLLGDRVHDRTPLAWWNIDTSVEDMVAECKTAHAAGYDAYKTKGRPWFDVWAQVDAVEEALPESFHLALDFNDTLLDAERGIRVLADLARSPNVAIFESPIFQTDVKGNRKIRKATGTPVAMHYGSPPLTTVVRERCCDGFVVGKGAARLTKTGHACATHDMPFWLQLVGTGITASWSLQFGAVLSHATWPAVNCHQLFVHDLLKEPIVVRDGHAAIPEAPGLGHAIDWDAVEKYRVEKPPRRPEPERLIETTWPDGRKFYIANDGRVNFMLNHARNGKFPWFEKGVDTRLVPDDGSQEWRETYEKARREPFLLGG